MASTTIFVGTAPVEPVTPSNAASSASALSIGIKSAGRSAIDKRTQVGSAWRRTHRDQSKKRAAPRALHECLNLARAELHAQWRERRAGGESSRRNRSRIAAQHLRVVAKTGREQSLCDDVVGHGRR